MANDRMVAGGGRIVLAIGVTLIFVSGVLTGALVRGGTGADDSGGYDVTRAVLLFGFLWAAGGVALWRVGRVKLFGLGLAVAIAGYALGAFAFSDLDGGGSADSLADVGLVIGGIGSFVGLLIAWSGARLAGPSILRR